MPEKVLFKTGRIHGFSNRNAADDAEAVWRSHKKKSAKNYSLDRQTTSSQIGEITGVKRNCFSNILPFSPNIVFLSLPRNLTAALFCLPPSGRSWQNHIPFGRSCIFQATESCDKYILAKKHDHSRISKRTEKALKKQEFPRL